MSAGYFGYDDKGWASEILECPISHWKGKFHLRSALTTVRPTTRSLAETIGRRFAAFGGVEVELPQRDAMRQAPEFAE